MAKNLSTRIGLKVDTLTAWESSNIGLLPGELAIATVAAGAGSGLSEPVIMIKVGEDGVKTFKDLDWAVHAKASDVYGWAKKSEAEFVNGFLNLTNGTNTLGQILDEIYITHNEQANALSQLKTELAGIYYNKTEIDTLLGDYYKKTEIDGITGDLSALNTTNKANLVVAINETLQAVEVGGTGSVVTVTKEATPTTGSQATYVVKQGGKAVGEKIEIPVGYDETALAGRVSTVETAVNTTLPGQIQAVDAKFADYTKTADLPKDLGDFTNNAGYAKTADVNKTLEDYAKTADLPTKVSELENDVPYLVASDITGKADSTKVAEDIAAAIAPLATTAALNEYKEAHKDDYTNKQIDDAIAAVSGDLANYYTKSEADAEFATPTEVIDAVNEALAKVSDADSITNITTLVEYVNENAGDLSALITEVYGAAEMTGDSRIDTAVADAAQAKVDASAAVGTANSASTIAGEAKTLAEGAVTTANEAKTAATEAQNSAAASAAAAKTSEDNAKASEEAAGTAKADAEAAKGAAVVAQGAAEGARDAAVVAQSAAETAQGLAEEAKDAAVVAQGLAESAQSAAETAKGAAETAKTDAENAKTAAETAQGKAEAAQTAAEKAKADAEASNTSATAIANEAATVAGQAKSAAEKATSDVAGLTTTVNAIPTTYRKVADKITSDDMSDEIWIFNCGTATLVV